LFAIGNEEVLQNEFTAFLIKNHLRNSKENNPKLILERLYENFENQKILQYRENNLEQIDSDFKNLMKEYRDGILLFELTNNEVWSKAVSDTSGLKSFHEKNKEKYMWGERLSYNVYTVNDEKSLKKLEKLLKKGKESEQILAKLNKKNEVIKSKSFKAEKDSNPVVKELEWKEGFIKKETLKDNKIELTHVNRLLAPEPKLLKETRGYVISDYQDFLEKAWVKELKAKYPVILNEEVFNDLIKK
jgi:peptidyl-prolyl cis-trans isomerase SurA